MALILCTGVDEKLLTTRQLILEQAGHTVVTATNERQVAHECKMHQFEIAVLGHAVSQKIKRHIALVIRQQCTSAKILELYRIDEGRAVDEADSWLEVPPERPQQLVEVVAKLASQTAPAKP